jgi:4-diphosphocytidyl-2-C-methyl-D-erythritol kinase
LVLIVFPNCKINLGLNVLRKREDGFHDLETFFLPVNLCDALEILPSKHKTNLTTTGFPAGNIEDNLAIKAYHLIKKDYPSLPEVQIHLHKAIPLGAGLGGGSSDAAFTLKLINTKFHLNIPEKILFDYASQLGSDCAFFLLNKPVLAKGRGEILDQKTLSLKEYKIVLVNPGIHISTAEAFKNLRPSIPVKKIEEIIFQPVETWKHELSNDFEKYVFEAYPAIAEIKDDLYKSGAVYAAMSGSGSTVFGLFEKNIFMDYIPKMGYFYKVVNLI